LPTSHIKIVIGAPLSVDRRRAGFINPSASLIPKARLEKRFGLCYAVSATHAVVE
jgi:hypothetical protein